MEILSVLKRYSLFWCQLTASGLQVEFRKAPLLVSKCVCDLGVWMEQTGQAAAPAAVTWSLVFAGAVPGAVTAHRRDTISSLLVEQNTGTWCVCSRVTLLAAQGCACCSVAGQQLCALPRPCQPNLTPIKSKAAANSL